MSENIPIDPVLLNGDVATHVQHHLTPTTDARGNVLTRIEDFKNLLAAEKRKQPLHDVCISLGIRVPARANLERLRDAILIHWYHNDIPLQTESVKRGGTVIPANTASISAATSNSAPVLTPVLSTNTSTSPASLSCIPVPAPPHPVTPSTVPIPDHAITASLEVDRDDELRLVNEFGIEGADAEQVLAYDDDEDEENEDGWQGCALDGTDEHEGEPKTFADLESSPTSYKAYQIQVRVNATQRAEGNRRLGGLKTQRAMVRAWEEFTEQALEKGQIKDEIVDDHSLLVYINFCAERPKRTRKGMDIPGTFVGASQLKKLFFGALRIRKQQDAANPRLIRERPATSVIVWDAIKNRMDESLERVRNGLVPEEDAPDILANTFLAEITERQLDDVHVGFLGHRELRSVIYGHLAWTAQHASGNRGDDFRALKLAELQPWTMLHPNRETAVYSVLGLQGEEKAGKRGMCTKINPVYSVFIAHHRPDKCSLRVFAFYHHYLHDVKHLTESMDIDWARNKSWRSVRVLSGPKCPSTPFSDQSLYNLYVKAFAKAGFKSKVVVHLPRHILGYKQEAMGVDPGETSKMGWVRGETYFDTYRPAIPKTAVLAAHGYKAHESYDPVWRHIHVPDIFLTRMCPMAESIHAEIVGRENLSGAANYWSMVIALRPYLFQCGATLYEICPTSALFKLPAFSSADVKNWMVTTFRTELSILRAKEGSPLDLARIQNEVLRVALEELRTIVATQTSLILKLNQTLERRTAVLSPTKGFSNDIYCETASGFEPIDSFTMETETAATVFSGHIRSSSGVYTADDQSLRAFANSSPATQTTPRERTQVDLVLPPPAAFCRPGAQQFIWPPVLGQKGVRWTDIFPLIQQPQLLWDCWKPSKTLDQFLTVREVWDCYVLGEPVVNSAGEQTGVKPPLQLVEKQFRFSWRTGGPPQQKKAWERFREIPEWINSQSDIRGVAPEIIIKELESMRGDGAQRKGLNALMKDVQRLRKKARQQQGESQLTELPPSLPPVSTPIRSSPPMHASTSPLQSPFHDNSAVKTGQGKRKRAPAVDARLRVSKRKI